MSKETIKIPDIGSESAEVIEISVAVGDEVAAEDSLVVLESDKASMEVPCPKAGKITAILVKEGQSISEGDDLVEIELTGESDESAEPEPAAAESKTEDKPAAEEAQPESASDAESSGASQTVTVPDIGTDDEVDVIEVCVAEGDEISEGDSLVVLESDKASMEIPSPYSGKVESIALSVGEKAKKGDDLLVMQVAGSVTSEKPAAEEKPAPKPEPDSKADAPKSAEKPKSETPALAEKASKAPGGEVYAGPAVRKLAREFSIDIKAVTGSGPKGRVLKEDLQAYVKNLVENKSPAANGSAGAGIPAVPEVDFAQFGDVVTEPASKLHKLTAANMHRSWLNVPHVTQWDDADITELEAFRKGLKAEAEKKGVKMTPLPFLLKACAAALKANPKFNASLADNGETLVFKQYVHIGIAVDTPAGLVVPVVRDVDKKSLWELAEETAQLAAKAKDRKLKPQEMQGGCFTISSLGNIGGLGFTPIVNTPEVGILGVSKLTVKPVWNGSEFVPREMLPLSLSYDHRAINGADAGRFFSTLNEVLGDIRRLLL
ncbi:pyruvate dehydrogenase E2 component (dihydrolipoamide acetyltransferase) [Litorivivens lipolytica]|uniref:Acetyltransferase component of pyruvate dehydrogenase complex n=1 Tax=Litorivivens lipolytica TaxID=1524264 RepID=A0A7W4W2N3_9GAMM|nr:pyruvate dehydrogenase E2 component (dihydrolipoamide acetyltransferase) [Litorivivens lipolytica]